MKYVSLHEFCIGDDGKLIHGRQALAARYMRRTPFAIKKIIDSGRQVTLVFDDDGEFVDSIEVKSVRGPEPEAA